MADNLLDKASILLTPTAYNDGSMLSIKPENGDGDFDFSRSSAATRGNAQGLVENVQIISSELVSNGDFSQIGTEEVLNGDFSQEGSELITNGDFSQGSQNWSLIGDVSISNGVATFLDSGSNTNSRLIQSSISIGNSYKVTFEVTRYVNGRVQVVLGSGTTISVDISSGVGTYTIYGVSSGSNQFELKRNGSYPNFDFDIDNVSVKEVGQDWTLGTGWSIGDGKATTDGTINSNCYQDAVTTIGQTYKYSFDVLDSGSGVIDGRFRNGGGVIQSFSSEGTYTGTFVAYNTLADFTTLSGNTASFSITNISLKEITDDTDLPRIDYTDGCGSWLLEGQSTNLVTYSEDFSQWSSYITTPTLNSATSPSGDVNAAKLTSSGAFGNLNLTISKSSSALNYTQSVFVKAVNYSIVNLISYGSSSADRAQVSFDLSDGSISSAASVNGNYTNPSESIEDYGNGWYRISLSFTSDTSVEVRPHIQFPAQMTSSDYVLLWGAQLEQQSYATSYIPTNGSISTRLADVATNSGNATLINSTEGVLYAEIAALADDGTSRQISISDSSYNNTLLLRYLDLTNTLQGVFRVDGAFKGGCNFTLSNPTDSAKVAYKYKNSDFALWVNGAEVSTSTDSFSISANTLNELSFDRGDGTQYFYGKAKAVAVFPILTDAELQSLTTI